MRFHPTLLLWATFHGPMMAVLTWFHFTINIQRMMDCLSRAKPTVAYSFSKVLLSFKPTCLKNVPPHYSCTILLLSFFVFIKSIII